MSETTDLVAQQENVGLLRVSDNMLQELQNTLTAPTTRTVPIASLTALGAGVSSMVPELNQVTSSTTVNMKGLYQCVNQGAGDALKKAKDGTSWGAVRKTDGSSVMGKFKEVSGVTTTSEMKLPVNPSTMLMAASLCAIEAQLGEIKETQQQIFSFLETDKESDIEGDALMLMDVMTKYKHNWDNEYFVSGYHGKVLDIQHNALQNMNFYQKQIKEAYEKKHGLVNQMKVEEVLSDLQKKFKYYRMALYNYSLASLLEIMLSGNYAEDNIAGIRDRVSGMSSDYRELFCKCSVYMEKLGSGAVEKNVLKGVGFAGCKLGEFIGEIPVVSKGPVDEFLQEKGENLTGKAERLEEKAVREFASLGDPGTRIPMEKMQDIIEIYNHTETIYFDSEKIYLVEA